MQNERSKRLKRNRQAELEAARLAKEEKEEEEVRQQALLAKKEKISEKKPLERKGKNFETHARPGITFLTVRQNMLK